MGYELHRSLDLAVGKTITFRGQPLVVSALQPQRGNQDDITLWINLAEAQKLLDKQGQINAILAIECNCAADRLATIRGEIARVLPDTQVIEFASQALARAEARRPGRRGGHARRSSGSRQAVPRRGGSGSGCSPSSLPVVIGACAVWAGLLALGNVRARIAEIGILRALGVPSARVLTIFLARAVLIGLAGGLIGFLAGWLGSWLGEERHVAAVRCWGRGSRRCCAARCWWLTPLFSALVSLAAGDLGRGARSRGELERESKRAHVGTSARICRKRYAELRPAGGAGPSRPWMAVDLRLAGGEFLAVQGPSGSGKSTLLLIAGGLLTPSSGRVLFEGQDVYALRPRPAPAGGPRTSASCSSSSI